MADCDVVESRYNRLLNPGKRAMALDDELMLSRAKMRGKGLNSIERVVWRAKTPATVQALALKLYNVYIFLKFANSYFNLCQACRLRLSQTLATHVLHVCQRLHHRPCMGERLQRGLDAPVPKGAKLVAT